MWLLKATRGFLRSFQWARDAADRLVSSPYCHPFVYICLSKWVRYAEHMMLAWHRCVRGALLHAHGIAQCHHAAPVQAFADILASNETFAAPMEDTYKLLDLNPADTTTLEQYLQALY